VESYSPIHLDLSQNLLSGLLSPVVGNLKALGTLNISINKSSDEILNALQELQMLSVWIFQITHSVAVFQNHLVIF